LNVIGVLNAAALALRPFTIVRTRFDIYYSTDQVAASETPFGALGLIVASDKAVALGVTAIPQPFTNSDADFWVWQGVSHKFFFGDATGFSNVGQTYTVDSKAMRKVGNDEDIAVCFEQSAAVGAQVIVQGRMLVKLH